MEKGRGTRIALEANKKLKDIYIEKGIQFCEIRLSGCLIIWPLAFCHRHRRWWYTKKPDLLSSYNQTVIGCQSCHEKIDSNKKLLEDVFLRLRGIEK